MITKYDRWTSAVRPTTGSDGQKYLPGVINNLGTLQLAVTNVIKSPIEPSKAGALFPPIPLASFIHIMGEVNKPVTYSPSRRENLPL